MNLFKLIKDTIAPKKCYSCKIEGHFLCKQCFNNINKISPYCYICKKASENYKVHKQCKKNIYYDKLIILSQYNNIFIKKLIKNSKFYGGKDILEDFGYYLGNMFFKYENIEDKDSYIIVPVPMFYLRKMKRGYNHSEVLSKYISNNTGINYVNLIRKTRNTIQQSKLSKSNRILNLNNSFELNRNLLSINTNKKIILVDDVVSTTSTINEISKILKKAGYKNIVCLCIASN